MILQAFIDDSGSDGPPVIVLAGFVATAADWGTFSDEWEAVLKTEPPINYFKMKEAAAARGEFHKWEKPAIHRRIEELIAVIEKHAPLGIACIVEHAKYRNVFTGKIAKAIDNPYLLVFFGVMQTLMRVQAHSGTSEKVDFIFDEQMGESDKVLNAWTAFRELAPQFAVPMIGNRPIFRSDHNVMPLQAADLLAWKLRRERYRPHDILPVLKFKTTMIVEDTIDEDRMKTIFAGFEKLNTKFGIAHTYNDGKKKKKTAQNKSNDS